MCTIAKSPDVSKGAIHIDPKRVIAPVDDRIYSGFTEHMGRCIYGGLVSDPKAPSNPSLLDENGFRTDVAVALKELNMPLVRYPGGNFVATYNWLDGVGPIQNRPRRPELAWLGEESNHFGTDEFMKWCKMMNREPYLCLNMGTGTLMEALAWVEYCNSTSNTYYANLRRQNGHPDPYNVRYWALGNEIYGPWQVEAQSKEDYSKKAIQWAKALRLLDPTIKLIGCGCRGYDDWDRYVLQETIEWVDFHSIHIYTCSNEYYSNVFAPASAEKAIQIASELIDFARIVKAVKTPKQRICFDEWNVWDPERAVGSQGAEEKYTLSDALAVASWLNVFIRQAKVVGIANIAQSVNVISPIMTSPDGLYLQTTYFPLLLFSKYMRGGDSLAIHVESPVYSGKTFPEWLQFGDDALPFLDVSTVITGNHIFVAVVNRHETEDITTTIKFVDYTPKDVHEWIVAHEDVNARNNFGSAEVGIREKSYSWNSNPLIIAKHSFTLLKFSS